MAGRLSPGCTYAAPHSLAVQRRIVWAAVQRRVAIMLLDKLRSCAYIIYDYIIQSCIAYDCICCLLYVCVDYYISYILRNKSAWSVNATEDCLICMNKTKE